MVLRATFILLGCLLALPARAIDTQITITSETDAENRRQQLINNAWGVVSGQLPTTKAQLEQKGATDPWNGTTWFPHNVSRVDIYTTPMSNGQTNTAYMYFAGSPNNHRFVALNPGHAETCDWRADATSYNMQPVLMGLLAAGYSVFTMNMPVGSGSTGSFNTPNSPCGDVGNHNTLFTTYGDAAMQYFLEPLVQVINFLQAPPANYFPDGVPFTDYNIAGLSGGGWTCMAYMALDTRIHNGICVAGSMPGLWFVDGIANPGNSSGDQEQSLTPYYTIAGYLDQYVLAALGQGRLHRQILDVNDNCCFGQAWWRGGQTTALGTPITDLENPNLPPGVPVPAPMGSFFNWQAYYSATGGTGPPGAAAQCGNAPTCDWDTYTAYYSNQLTSALPAIGPGTILPVVRDPQATTHQISVCGAGSPTINPYTSTGLTVCTAANGTTSVGGQLDGLSLIIATLDSNPPTAMLLGRDEILATTSGLTYSRSSRTFGGTITITNISNGSIAGPFQIVLASLTSGVTLTNATGSFGGSPFLTVTDVSELSTGDSATVKMQFSNPSFGAISFVPTTYAGTLQ